MFGRTAIALCSAVSIAGAASLLTAPIAPLLPQAHADYAQSGNGQFVNSVYWFDLSKLASGAAASVPAGKADKFGHLITVGDSYTYTEADGLPAGYSVTVTVTSASLGATEYTTGELTHLATRPMNTWSGATSYTYYNTGTEEPAIGNVLAGSDTVPADAYTATDLQTITVSMSATFNGVSVPLTVIATDAESTSGEVNSVSGRTEELFFTVNAGSQWQLMEFLPAAGSTATAPRLTVHNPGTAYPDSGGWGTNRIGTFATQDAQASHLAAAANATEVTAEFRLSSPTGAQAFALGAAVAVDTGDAPASYGNPTHLLPLVPGGVAGDTTTYPTLGAAPVDGSEDISPTIFGPVYAAGSLAHYSVTVPASGEGATVAGWIDVNNDGTFSADERASATVAGGEARLTWKLATPIPAEVTELQARLRVATQSTEVANPTGGATTGEVEDLTIPVSTPRNQTSTGAQNRAQSVPLSAMFPGAPATATYSFDPALAATQKIVPGEGTYTLVGTALLFDPEPAFAGTVTTPPTVFIHSPQGATGSATYTPTVSAVTQSAPVIAAAPGQDQPTNFDLGDQVHAGDTLTVANTDTAQGRWVVNPDNTITFYPHEGFGGVAANTYTITDALDQTRSGSLSVVYPDVEPIAAQTGGATTVIPTRVTAGDPATVQLVTADGGLTSVIVTSEGNWQVTDGGATITFTAAVGFTGIPTPALYTVSAGPSLGDAAGTATPATVTISEKPVVPVVTSVFTTGAPGVEVTLTPQGTTIDPATTVFVTQGQPRGATVSADGTTITVPGEGTWVAQDNGSVVFTPQAGFVGDPTPVLYTGSRDGVAADPARLDITYLTDTVADSGETALSVITTVDTLGQVQRVEASTLFTRMGQVVPAEEYFLVTATGQREPENTVLVDTVGTFTIDPATGTLTFTPAPGFIGIPPAITLGATIGGETVTGARYQPVVTDSGSIREGATQTVVVRPVATVGQQFEIQHSTDRDTGDNGLHPGDIFTGVPLVGATYWVDQPGRTEFLAPGEGSYTIDATTGTVTFSPTLEFTGTGTGVTVGVTTTTGATYTSRYTPTVLPENPPATPRPQLRPIPLTSVAMRGQAQFSTDSSAGDNGLNPEDAFPMADLTNQAVTFWIKEPGTTYVDAGIEGTYRVSPTGVIMYLPDGDFVGIATPLTYGVTTADGQTFRTSYTPMVMPNGAFEPIQPSEGTNSPATPNTGLSSGDGSANPAIVAPVAIASAVLGGLVTWVILTGLTPQGQAAPPPVTAADLPPLSPAQPGERRLLAVTGPQALTQILLVGLVLLLLGGAGVAVQAAQRRRQPPEE